MKLKTTLFTLFGFILFVILFKITFNEKKPTLLQVQYSKTTSIQTVKQPFMPGSINFANEKVPVHLYDVRERLDKELLVNMYWHSSTSQLIKRANRYFPVIEQILEEEGLPDDFKYLAVAESGLENVVSPSGAVGFWQFLKGAAKDFNLEVNNEVDERYHLEKATRAACRYLKWNKKKFGTWALSAAAYNYGRTNTLKQMKRQKCNSYYNLLLPEETERYIFRLIALKLIMSDPEKYGFYFQKNELYAPVQTRTIKLNGSIDNFAEFAEMHGISYRMLKEFNPWLRKNYLKNRSKKTYIIEIPTKRFRYIYNHLTF